MSKKNVRSGAALSVLLFSLLPTPYSLPLTFQQLLNPPVAPATI
jgi:hypothetical protein